MNNLASLMKTVNEIHITKKERKYLLQEALRTYGNEMQLVVAIEEISELINVLSDNITDEFNYLHTAEEVTDVMIATKELCMIANIPVPKHSTHHNKGKMKIIRWYSQLSKSQQWISKYIRHGSVARDKLLMAIDILTEVTSEVIDFCGIYKEDIAKIETLKMKRLQDRLRNK